MRKLSEILFTDKYPCLLNEMLKDASAIEAIERALVAYLYTHGKKPQEVKVFFARADEKGNFCTLVGDSEYTPLLSVKFSDYTEHEQDYTHLDVYLR